MQYSNNFMTYLKWRGDLTLKDAPFNEIDALILSELVYIHFEDVVPTVEEEGCISIADANKKYVKSISREMPYYVQKEALFDVVAQCPRYMDMTLCNYVSNHNIVKQEQFAVFHVNVSPDFTVIAFRGTDSTVTGWREDCNMSFMMPVPAQKSAVEYVNQTVKGWFKKYSIVGHSKGGNLAIYSGVFCNPKIQKKIAKIYSFDGPGFNRKVVDDAAYKAVENRILAFVPQSSIVGMLMEHEESYKVVKSEEFSILQHEGFSWQVDRDKFVLADEVDPFSKNFSSSFKTWLKELSPEERKQTVDAFFDVFENAGIVDFMEMIDIDVKKAAALIKEVAKMPHGLRDKLGKLIKLLIEENTKR